MKLKPNDNPFNRKPDNPNYLRRAWHHDYTRPARYMITFCKDPAIPRFCNITAISVDLQQSSQKLQPQENCRISIPQENCRISIPEHENGKVGVRVELTRTGAFFEDALEKWLQKFPQIAVAAHVIMPDHIHLCIHVLADLPNGLTRALANLKGITSSMRFDALPEHFKAAGIQPVFSRGFNDRIAYSDNQWNRQKIYIFQNPRRYIMKKQNPYYLLRRWITNIDGKEFMLIGNIFLLDAPHLFPVKFRRHFTTHEIEDFTRKCKAQVDNGSVAISPYIHPKEKEIREYAIDTGFSFIRICENGMLQRQYPQGRDFLLITAGRLLLIAPMEHESQRKDMKYTYARELNTVAIRIADLCNSGFKPLITEINQCR